MKTQKRFTTIIGMLIALAYIMLVSASAATLTLRINLCRALHPFNSIKDYSAFAADIITNRVR